MPLRPALPFLALQLSGTLCSAMIVPYMGFFIVEGLGYAPWVISIYAFAVVALTLFLNRRFAQALDSGQAAFPLIGVAATGYLIATLGLSLSPTLPVVLIIGVLGFSLGSSAVSTMFTLSRAYAQSRSLPADRFGVYMRATTSTGWMMGPALSFFVADQFGPETVFKICTLLVLVWLLLWWQLVPRQMTTLTKEDIAAQNDPLSGNDRALRLAALVCFCLSTAHSLTFTALPLFYVQEVGLPTFAPGLHFSIKTFVEIFAILSTPFLIARFGLRRMLGASILLAVGAIQVLAQVTSLPQMMLGAAIEGLYYGFYASLSISFVQSFAKGRFAHATALYWNTLMVSGLLAGPMVGLIAQYVSFGAAIQLASLGAVLAIVVLIVTRTTADAQTHPT